MIPERPRALTALAAASAAAVSACTHVTVDPIKLEPIDITLHIYLEADRKLDAFFNDVDHPATPVPKPEHTEGGHP